MAVLVNAMPWVTGSMGILAPAYSSRLWIASAQKCGGVQAKMIITSSQGSAESCPVMEVQPSSGGMAPASPPMTIFWGVARFSSRV
ncbi:hypothetical protein D3C87_1838660 [compost metagenome]